MALYTFGDQTGPIPLSQLDYNFAQPVEQSNVANTVLYPAQANITSLGQLTGLSVAGNIIATGNISTSTSLLSTGNIITTANLNAQSMFIDNSGFANAVITGNLTVQGNLNSVGTTNISTGNLTITLGNAILANNSVALNGAGIIIGATPTATFFYNFGTNSFQSSLALTPITTVAGLNLGNTTNQWRSLFAANVFLTGNVVAGNIQSNNYSATNITASGELAVSGNIATSGGVSVAGNIVADGNIVGAIIASSVSVAGTITVTGLTASGNLVSAGITTGNVTMANIFSGNVLNSGNITTIGVAGTGLISTTGNVVGGNIRTTGVVTATGRVTATGGLTTAGNTTIGGGVNYTVRNLNIGVSEIAWVPTDQTTAFVNVSDSAGNNGSTYSVVVRGLTSSGSAPQNLANFTVYATNSFFQGALNATGDVTAYYSDERLKTKLGSIENALDKLTQLSGFYYEANEVAQALGYEAKREVGVSAQQVQKVMPEIVKPAPVNAEYLTVQYEKLIPLLIEAIKELKSEVDVLKGKI